MLATVLVFWFFCMHKLFEKALRGLDLVLLLKKKKAQFYTQLHSEAGRGRRKKRWLTSLICDSGVTEIVNKHVQTIFLRKLLHTTYH